MPHLTVHYTPQLDAECDMAALCTRLAETLCALRDPAGQAVFPTGGIRVLAYPAAHAAVADGAGDYAFAYLNLRIARGRPAAVQAAVGEALSAVAREHFAPLLARRPLGVTVQVDEGHEVFDAKHSSLHPLFRKD